MPGKDGGKVKPLKAAKKEKAELTAEDLAFKQKQMDEKKKLAELKGQLANKGFVKAKSGGKK
jgi:hypothetical protein